jgi:hypothetical protein
MGDVLPLPDVGDVVSFQGPLARETHGSASEEAVSAPDPLGTSSGSSSTLRKISPDMCDVFLTQLTTRARRVSLPSRKSAAYGISPDSARSLPSVRVSKLAEG